MFKKSVVLTAVVILCFPALLCSGDAKSEAAAVELTHIPGDGSRKDAFLVAIRNSTNPCVPIWFDAVVDSGTGGGRPLTTITLKVEPEEKGQVSRREPPSISYRGFRPSQVIYLQCGHRWVVHVSLDDPRWYYDLSPGVYLIQARVQSRLASFLSKDPATLKEFFDGGGKSVIDIDISSIPIKITVE